MSREINIDFTVDDPQRALVTDINKLVRERSFGLETILNNLLLSIDEQLNSLIKSEYTTHNLEDMLREEYSIINDVKNASQKVTDHLKSTIRTVKESEQTLSIVVNNSASEKIKKLNDLLKYYDKFVLLQKQYNDAMEMANFIELENIYQEMRKYKSAKNFDISEYELSTAKKNKIYKSCFDKLLDNFQPIILVNLIIATKPTPKGTKNKFATRLIEKAQSKLPGVLVVLNEIANIFSCLQQPENQDADSFWKRLKEIMDSDEVQSFYKDLPALVEEKCSPSQFLTYSEVYKNLPPKLLESFPTQTQISNAFSDINSIDKNFFLLSDIAKNRKEFASRCAKPAARQVELLFDNIERHRWIDRNLERLSKALGEKKNAKQRIPEERCIFQIMSMANAARILRELGSPSDFCDTFPLLALPFNPNLDNKQLEEIIKANPHSALDLSHLKDARDELFHTKVYK